MKQDDIKRALDALAAEAVSDGRDLWPAIQAQLADEDASRRRRQHGARVVRVALATGIAAVIVFLTSAPQARARLLEFLRIGNVEVMRPEAVEETVTPPTLPPAPELNLGGATTLEEVEARTGLVAPLPKYPPDLGLPDAVFLQDEHGPFMVLVWFDDDAPGQVALALHVLGPRAFGQKTAPESIEAVEVNGQPALWTTGPHMLMAGSGVFEMTQLVEGNVLIWTLGDLTLRLESDLPLGEALRVAESVRVGE